MKFSYVSGRMESLPADALVLFVPKMKKIGDRQLQALDRASRGALTTLVGSGEFTGSEGEVATVFRPQGYYAQRVLLVGLGDLEKINADTFRRASGHVPQNKSLTSGKRAVFYLGNQNDPQLFRAVVEGYLLGSYTNLAYKSGEARKGRNNLSELVFAVDKSTQVRALRDAVARGQIVAEGQILVRQLASAPSNFLTPKLYAKKIGELAREYGMSSQILDEKAIAREKMGCLLAVARGSAELPRFAIVRYNGQRPTAKPIVLVGKGVTFDSGGISLKPGLDMHEMKGDMTGSAVVFATLVTAARLKLPLNLVALMPLTENMPSGVATKPGDIVTSRKGLTVEIINTDAEGRLILADALDYANTFKPQAVIDIATLTGAALYVLGYAGAPVVGNNGGLMGQLKAAADQTAERVWEMPLWDDYREAMKSGIADLQNSGGRPAGTLTASAFLENFIGHWPWAHIDIAYVDLEPKGKPYMPKGATGFGLRLLVELLSQWKPVAQAAKS
jgi:leucyl aminopeptidase